MSSFGIVNSLRLLKNQTNNLLDLSNTPDELSNCLSLDLLSLLVPLSKFNVALTKPNGLA